MIKDAAIHHIGIAVLSIDKAKVYYEKAGFEVSDTVVEEVQKVRVAYANRANEKIELLEPLNDSSPVCSILKKSGCTPYHICYSVKDIYEAIKELKTNGFIPLAKPVQGHGLDDALMCFLYNKDVGLIQIVEIK